LNYSNRIFVPKYMHNKNKEVLNWRLIVKKLFLFLIAMATVASCSRSEKNTVFNTEITEWQDDKQAAVSITYDGGTINQFEMALPIMKQFDLPATFFIVSGSIKGSKYHGKYIGKPLEEIIKESAESPTDKNNFFERASALQFAPYDSTREFHILAGTYFEREKITEAYNLVDRAFQKLRNGELEKLDTRKTYQEGVDISWDELEKIADLGYEFASHTITHPQLTIMDDENINYELEKSKEELQNQLGNDHTFSIELPYAIEKKRVLDLAFNYYQAIRNRLTESYIEEINRWDDVNPGSSDKEYVFWERGPKTKTQLGLMQSWVDTCLNNDNVWLVLVIHGVEGIGWEPVSRDNIYEYFNYIHSKKEKVWAATFQDGFKYIRERMNADIKSRRKGDAITIELTHSLDKNVYDLPLTLKTYLPPDSKDIEVKQSGEIIEYQSDSDENGSFVIYRALPNNSPITISLL